MDKVAEWNGMTQSHGFCVEVYRDGEARLFVAQIRTSSPALIPQYIPGTPITMMNFEGKSFASNPRRIRAPELYVHSSKMEMRYWPRKSRFPIIVDTGRGPVGALSGAECAKRIAQLGPFESDASMPVVDATAEGFGFYPKMMLISPLVTKKRWTKAEVSTLFNDCKKPDAPEYRPVSLSNRVFDRVVHELVELLREP
jgi:hypothetical protein